MNFCTDKKIFVFWLIVNSLDPPPYHCEFNPIEMVWGDVKGYVGRENNTFKNNDVKDLIIKGFKTITPEKWTNFCNHVVVKSTHLMIKLKCEYSCICL
jgi:transposase